MRDYSGPNFMNFYVLEVATTRRRCFSVPHVYDKLLVNTECMT